MERETGIEPATNSLEGCDSTIELLPHFDFRFWISDSEPPALANRLPPSNGKGGDAQSKVQNRKSEIRWWTGEGSNLRRPHGSADLQSAAFDRSATCPVLCSPDARCGRNLLRSTPTLPRLSRVVRVRGWARGHLDSRARLGVSRLEKPAPESPSGARLLAPPAAALAQAGAGEGIRTPDPLITNQMLYQLSYASRPKPIIIPIGPQIARAMQIFFEPARFPLGIPDLQSCDGPRITPRPDRLPDPRLQTADDLPMSLPLKTA